MKSVIDELAETSGQATLRKRRLLELVEIVERNEPMNEKHLKQICSLRWGLRPSTVDAYIAQLQEYGFLVIKDGKDGARFVAKDGKKFSQIDAY